MCGGGGGGGGEGPIFMFEKQGLWIPELVTNVYMLI